jgi:hypothetical protein
MAYLSEVDIKHATSAVDQLTVTRLQWNGQIATLRRLQVAQFRYGTPVLRRLMTRNITAPHVPEFTIDQQITKQIKKRKNKKVIDMGRANYSGTRGEVKKLR